LSDLLGSAPRYCVLNKQNGHFGDLDVLYQRVVFNINFSRQS
jgi:hypothetical protein